MNRCKTCTYWGDVFDNGINKPNDCDFWNTITGEKSETGFNIVATVHDDSGLNVVLMTKPNFGCINWSKK